MSSVAVDNIDSLPQSRSKKAKTGGRSGTVAKMLLSNRWATVYMATFLPLIVGAALATIGLVTAAIARYPLESLGAFYAQNSVHPVLIAMVYIATSFMLFSRNTSLVLSMGITKRDFWRGYVRTSALLSLITAGVYTVFALIEFATLGYSIGWQVVSSASPLIMMKGLTPAYHVFMVVLIALAWFVFVLASQFIGATLALSYQHRGILAVLLLTVPSIIFLAFITSQMGITFYLDFGFHLLVQPYEFVEENIVYRDGPLQLRDSVMMIFPAKEHIISQVFRYEFFNVLGIVLSYGVGAILLKQANFR